MNKALKIVSIVGGGLVAVGLALSLIGIMAGGGPQSFESRNGIFSNDPWWLFGNYSSVKQAEQTLEPFTRLSVKGEALELDVVPSDTQEWKARIEHTGNITPPTLVLKDGELQVRSNFNWKHFRGRTRCKVQIFVPRDSVFEEMDFDMDAVDVKLKDFTVENLLINADAANIWIEGIEAQTTRCELDAAAIKLRDSSLGDVQLSIDAGDMDAKYVSTRSLHGNVDMGNINWEGSFSGETALQVSMGNVRLTVDGKRADYALSLQSRMGTIRVDGDLQGNLAEQADSAANRILVTVSAGNADLFFQ